MQLEVTETQVKERRYKRDWNVRMSYERQVDMKEKTFKSKKTYDRSKFKQGCYDY